MTFLISIAIFMIAYVFQMIVFTGFDFCRLKRYKKKYTLYSLLFGDEWSPFFGEHDSRSNEKVFYTITPITDKIIDKHGQTIFTYGRLKLIPILPIFGICMDISLLIILVIITAYCGTIDFIKSLFSKIGKAIKNIADKSKNITINS